MMRFLNIVVKNDLKTDDEKWRSSRFGPIKTRDLLF